MDHRVTTRAFALALLTMGLVGGMAERAQAGPATLTITGFIDGSVGSTTFADAAFTAVASFSPSADLGGGGYGVYPASLTFAIVGVGTYTTAPDPDLLALIIGPPANPGLGVYGVVIPSRTGPLNQFFDAASTFLVPGGNVETLFSATTTFQQNPPFIEYLLGGSTLTVTDFDSLGATASLLVPEPGTLTLLAVGLAVTSRLRRLRRA